MFDHLKNHLADRRLRRGDGRPLQPFRWWHLLAGRKLLRLPPDGTHRPTYAVDVHQWGKQAGDDTTAHLYADDRHAAQSRLPARFPVEGGHIEVTVTMFGLRRCHFVGDDGAEHQLTPDDRSAIGRRLAFDRRHRGLSRLINVVSVVVLVVGVSITAMQIIEPVSEVPPLAQRFGTFQTPLPVWATVVGGLAAALASVDRALRLRYHWLLDGAAS